MSFKDYILNRKDKMNDRYIILNGNLAKLRSLSTMLLDANRADGFLPGVNAPPTNTMVDLANAIEKNLFNKYAATDGFFVSYTSGNLSANANFFVSEFIKLTNYTQLTQNGLNSGRQLAFYDSNKIYISGLLQATTFTIPTNAVYIRTSDSIANKDLFQLEPGSTATSYEPYNRNDLSLVNLAYTTASGYDTLVAPNGKTITALKLDGVDDYGILPNSADLDPTGLDDFGMAFVIKTGATLGFDYILVWGNSSSPTTPKLGLQFTGGNCRLFINGVAGGGLSAMTTDTFYKFVILRKNENVKVVINGIVVANFANSDLLSLDGLIRMFARTANADGTVHTDYFNGHFLAGDFTLNPTDKWEQDFNRYCQQQYGL